MKFTSHLLDEAIKCSRTMGNKDEKITSAHIIYGFAKLVTLEPAYANAIFTKDELASLEMVKQVLDYHDFDCQLIKIGMPFLASRNIDKPIFSDKLASTILDSCSDEESLIKEIIHSSGGELTMFSNGNSISDIIDCCAAQAEEGEKKSLDCEKKAEPSCSDDEDVDKDPATEEEHVYLSSELVDSVSSAQDNSDTSEGQFSLISRRTYELNKAILSKVIGQEEAVYKFVKGYFNANYSPSGGINGPRAAFFITGASGTGKSYMASIAADQLGMPTLEIDMKEFSIPSSITDFVGTERSFGGSEGRILKFVRNNPSGLIIIENLEECYLSILNMIAQILQTGKLYSPAKGEYVSFRKTTLIITSRLGRSIYDDPSSVNISALPQNIIVESIRNELSEQWHGDISVDSFCKGLESIEVIMLRNLKSRHLLSCITKSMEDFSRATKERYGYNCIFDSRLPALILDSAPAINDARTAIATCQNFIKNEFFEIAGLAVSGRRIAGIETLLFELDSLGVHEDIASLFSENEPAEILVVCDKDKHALFSDTDKLHYHFAECIDDVKAEYRSGILFAIVDPTYGNHADNSNISLEDSYSEGLKIILQMQESGFSVPVYALDSSGSINEIDKDYLLRLGIVDVIQNNDPLRIKKEVETAAIDESLSKKFRTLIKRNGYISYKSAQEIDNVDKSILHVKFYDLKMHTAISSSDELSIIRDTERPDTRFDDVIGAENAKSELKYFIKYLKDPKGFMLSGGKPPKGVLLYGPPGTGKTMLARAMAGESNVAFIQTSATQFMDKYVGESERRIRDLFRRAKQYAPAIIFIDEIDAIGKERTGSSTTQYTESMLNALLTEMDGFKVDADNPVFVLAATNYGMSQDPDDPRKLDEALLRRFDNKILVDLPNRDERIKFIKLRVGKISGNTVTEETVKNIAERTTGQSLAILQNVVDLAFRNSVKKGETLDDLMMLEALEEFNYGKKHTWKEEYYKSTAIHEAGHAVVAFLSGETPAFATIMSRGNFGGYVQRNSDENKPTYSRQEMLWNIRISLAGRAAEKVFFGEEESVNTGASSDLQAATKYALQMICSYGMVEGNLISLPVDTLLKTPLAQKYLDKANSLIEQEMQETEALITANSEKIEMIAEALLQDNYLTSAQINAILK